MLYGTRVSATADGPRVIAYYGNTKDKFNKRSTNSKNYSESLFYNEYNEVQTKYKSALRTFNIVLRITVKTFVSMGAFFVITWEK